MHTDQTIDKDILRAPPIPLAGLEWKDRSAKADGSLLQACTDVEGRHWVLNASALFIQTMADSGMAAVDTLFATPTDIPGERFEDCLIDSKPYRVTALRLFCCSSTCLCASERELVDVDTEEAQPLEDDEPSFREQIYGMRLMADFETRDDDAISLLKQS